MEYLGNQHFRIIYQGEIIVGDKERIIKLLDAIIEEHEGIKNDL